MADGGAGVGTAVSSTPAESGGWYIRDDVEAYAVGGYNGTGTHIGCMYIGYP
jgi:hypothetical protein